MTPTQAQLVALAASLGLLLVVGWRRGALGGARRRRRAAKRFARRSGLPAGAEPALVGRVVRRQRFVLAGIGVGLLAAGAVDQLWPAACYVGLAVGAVADRLTQPAAPPGARRVAHAASTRVTDYVPAWLLGAVAVAAAAVPAVAVLWLVAPRTERHLGDPELSGRTVLALVLLTLAALLASLLLARVIVGRRAAAGSAADLAIDDALRAQAVRDALHLSAATSVLAAYVVSSGLVEQDVDGVLRRVGGWFPLVLLAALAVVGIVHEVRGPRHWRSRLHPELDRAAVDA